MKLRLLPFVAEICRTDLASDGRHQFVRTVAKEMPSQESRLIESQYRSVYETMQLDIFVLTVA